MKTKLPVRVLKIDEDGFHLAVTISINGKKANVIVDTGASRTVFDKERIKRFVKTPSKKLKGKLSSGLGTNSMESHHLSIKKLGLGKININDYSTVLLDLSHVNNSYRQLGIKEVEGVLGSDILRKFKAVIDYHKKCLRLST